MKKLGIFVGEESNWMFFKEIYALLSNHFLTDVYQKKVYRTPLLYGRLNRWSYHKGIEATLRKNDVCFFEWASELLVIASHLPKVCPIITRLHSFELFAWAPKVNWSNVDKIILVSRAMQQKFATLYPEHANKTTVIYNGVDLIKYQPIAGKLFGGNLGILGSINPRKGAYSLVLVLYQMLNKGWDLRLQIGGGRIHGPDLDEYFVAIERLIEKLDLSSCVKLYGTVTDTGNWLHNIDLFISNSYWEGQQVALLEAMACGCYCLSHFWDGAEEVLPSENIYVTEAELEQKIVKYIHAADEEKLAQQSRMREIACDKFDIERTRQEIRREIDDLCSARGA